MICPHCGAETSDDSAVCSSCGQALEPTRTPPRPEGLDELTSSEPSSSVVPVIPIPVEPVVPTPIESAPTVAHVTPTPVEPVSQTQTIPVAVPQSSEQTAYVPAEISSGTATQPAKKSGGLGKLPLIVAVLAVLAVAVYGVGRMAGLFSPARQNVSSIQQDWGADYVDSAGNPTASALFELSGDKLAQMLEEMGFSYQRRNLTWVSSDGNNGVFVNSFEGGVEEELDEAHVRALAAGGKGAPIRYGIVVDSDKYDSAEDALKAIVPMDIDGIWLEDGWAIGIVESAFGDDFLVYFEEDAETGLFYCHLFNEEAIEAGFFDDFTGSTIGSSMDDIRAFLSDSPTEADVQADESAHELSSDEEGTAAEGSDEPTKAAATDIKLLGVRKDKAWDGKDCVVVSLEFTNTSSETASFGFICDMSVFQNGVSLNQTLLEDEQNDNYYTELRPGAKVAIDVAYEIKDDSDVEVEISNFWDYDSDEPLVVQSFKL